MGSLPDKGELQAGFNAGQPATKLLYHAIPVAPQGDAIRTSTNYGMDIRPEILAALGVTDTDHPPLVFASGHFTKALACGLDTFASEKAMNMGIDGTQSELVLILNRDVTMSRERSGKVYAFPADGFVELPYADRQSVSTAPVKFKDAEVVLEIKSADDLMRAGLQIISFRETAKELWNDAGLTAAINNSGDTYKSLGELVKQGRAVWENHARGINPEPVLAEKLGVALFSRNPKPVANPL